MFQKKNNEKLESFIGANSSFKGDIQTKGTLRIDGTVEGNIDTDWLIIGEKGSLIGDVRANGVIVGGKIEGMVNAKEIIEIKGKGEITGDINTPKLSVSEGAILNGRATMTKDTNVIELQVRSKA
jgi:cytoskeletal protein CcmA (bactofilin family)